MAEALHVSNGDATDVPGTGLARRVIYWRDVPWRWDDGTEAIVHRPDKA